MSKKLSKVIPLFAVLGILGIYTYPMLPHAFAATENANFQVNVKEILTVSVSTPSSWASGNINTFLRNKIGISVVSNNASGFTATMSSSSDNTSLTNSSNSSYTLPTLPGSLVRSSFPNNYWGYSMNDTDEGLDSSMYNPLVGANVTPITLISNDQSLGVNGQTKTTSRELFFGAKADATKASGTYSGTVVFNVVSGVISSDNPVTPANPATPIASGATNPAYDATRGRTVRTTTAATAGTTTTTTDVVEGDARDSFANVAGVTEETEANISGNTPLLAGIAAAASVAAIAGGGFLIASKRKRDDDEEDGDF